MALYLRYISPMSPLYLAWRLEDAWPDEGVTYDFKEEIERSLSAMLTSVCCVWWGRMAMPAANRASPVPLLGL